MLQLCSVDNPLILAGLNLANGNTALALRLAEEVVSLPELVRSEVAAAPAMALANETFSDFAVLVGLVSPLGVSYSSHFVKPLQLVHKLLFRPHLGIINERRDEGVNIHLSLARVE